MAENNQLDSQVPQEILDSLTKVEMPAVPAVSPTSESICIDGVAVPVYQCNTLVLGSGAAGMRAAVELKRRSVDVLVASTGLFSGTSACSGSDKQTLHTIGTDNKGDNYLKMAEALRAGGAMDAPISYIESLGSVEDINGL
ncbi:MAG: FAD-binding protein, partial [Planctomycetes bacterium]|nr:FAD-binding protein [Planctomycetota bacterium]